MQWFLKCGIVVACGVAALMTTPLAARATASSGPINIVSGPTLTPATNAPLAAVLRLTTDVDSRISVRVADDAGVRERDFYDYSKDHSVPLLGFKPAQTNLIQVTVYDKNRDAYTAPNLLTFVTAPLPADFPTYTVLTNEVSMMEPGYLLFIVGHNFTTGPGYITIMDNSGNVVWYRKAPASGDSDVRQLNDGNLFLQEQSPTNNFVEMDMLGDIVQTWHSPAGYPVNAHEGIVTDRGTILYISDMSRSVSNFPSSYTVSNSPVRTVNIDDNPVVEISATNSALLNVWSPLGVLDPTRTTYLTGSFPSPYGIDNEHANALIDDTNDNSIIVSLRNQNAVYKFSRSTGQLKWILGPHALWGANWQQYLLTPVSTSFDWNYGQHAPELTPEGTMLLYNDDNFQASPYDASVTDSNNYSSAVEYKINETNMAVSEVWNSAWQPNQDRLFTPYIGRVQWLPQTRNVLVTYGAVTYLNGVHPSAYASGATMVRMIEYTHDPIPQVVFDLSFFDYANTNSSYTGYDCYRAYQIPDLYAHPAVPVADLAISGGNQLPLLEFSADPVRSYLIQSSTDLTNWTTVGVPLQEGGVGDFDFYDLNADQFPARFYRTVTQ